MRILSSGHRSINEWCYAYGEVDLGLILGVVNCLHWKTNPRRSLGISIIKLYGSKYRVQLNGWEVKITKLLDVMYYHLNEKNNKFII